MQTVLAVFVVLLGGLFACYLAMPARLFALLRAITRARGGLKAATVRADGVDWPYLEGGNRLGKPLVMIHGFGGDKDNWALYAPFLKKHYRLIFPDLPGFGENARRLDADHSIGAQARRLGLFLDALHIEQCHLGGNSMGGAIALRFALDTPGRLLSLTLVNNAGVIGTAQSELQQLAEEGQNPLVPRDLADMDRLLGFLVYKQRFVPQGFKRIFFEDMHRHEALLDKIFNEVLEDALHRPLNDQVRNLRVPTLIIWGRHDRLLDVSCALVQHQEIAGSELVIFEDAGHLPMIEKPLQTARHQLAFLAKH